MESFFVDMVQKGGPAAVVSGFGILWLRSDIKGQIGNVVSDIQALEKVLRERCGLIHKEVERRLDIVERPPEDGGRHRRATDHTN